MMVDVGLKFYVVPSQFTWVTLRSSSKKFCVKILVPYLLNMDDLEVKVMDLDILY